MQVAWSDPVMGQQRDNGRRRIRRADEKVEIVSIPVGSRDEIKEGFGL